MILQGKADPRKISDHQSLKHDVNIVCLIGFVNRGKGSFCWAIIPKVGNISRGNGAENN